MSESAILAPLDAADLRSHGLLDSNGTTGSRRLHKRRLNRSSDEEHHDIPLNISPESPAAGDAFAMIPAALISRETLVYVGLSEAKATELWNRWINWPTFGPGREIDPDDGGLQVTFIDFIICPLENQVNTAEDDDFQWRACLNAYGINISTQDAIMDPHFKYLRLSESCLYWVKDTIEMRYAGLQDIQRSSREREMELRRMASRPSGHRGQHGGDGHQGGLSLGAGSSSSNGQGPRSVPGLQQQSTPGIGLEILGSASAIAAHNAPGYTTLFKGLDQGRITGLFNEAGVLDDIDTLLSSPPSDFSRVLALYYFTPDFEVAQYYAAYAKRRANCEFAVIVCLQIPNAAIESLSAPQIQRIYWPSSEWKELVWRCRARRPLSSHLRKYQQAILVIGTTSRKPDFVYRAMESWQGFREDCVLRVGTSGQNHPGVQYVFSGQEDGREFLLEHARNIRVFPFSQHCLEAWLAENPTLL